MVPFLLGLAAGVALPVQTAVNSRLRFRLGGAPLLASLISFTIGTAFLTVLTLLTGAGLGIPAGSVDGQPLWIWLGGILGVIFLTGNLLLFPHLGAVETVIMPVVGQLGMGMVIDAEGWFGSPHHPFVASRFAGAAMVLLGAVLAVRSRGTPIAGNQSSRNRWWWRLAGVLAGTLSAMQTAVNGRLGTLLGSAVHAAFISFGVGAAALVVLVAALRQWPSRMTSAADLSPWWMWLGGLLGALVVAGNAYLVPHLGTGLAVIIVLLGQMGGSVLIDAGGLLGAPRRRLDLVRVVGLVLMGLGVLVVRVL